MNPANIQRGGLWQQLQNQNIAKYRRADFTLELFRNTMQTLMSGKKKKPTRRKQNVKKVNGKAAN